MGVLAAEAFRLDVKGVEIRLALARAGVRSLLLKGAALDRLLYDGNRARSYIDVDLLIDPSCAGRAQQALVEHGFRRFEPESVVRQTDPALGSLIGVHGASHATAWLRESDNFVVDLHDSLPQVGAPADLVWRELTKHTKTVSIAGASTEVLDAPAAALLISLHAAHHGPSFARAIEDVARGLEILEPHVWRSARELALTLRCDRAMGVGLGLVEGGRLLAQSLSLPTNPTSAMELLWTGAPWRAVVLASLREQPTMRSRAGYLARILFPSPGSVRRDSALARRSKRGLLAAYAVRTVWLARLSLAAFKRCAKAQESQ